MGRFFLALRIFFRVLVQRDTAHRLRQWLAESPAPAAGRAVERPPAVPSRVETRAARSDALTLLAALQREARFVDFVMEPIDSYSDAQIGAAVRQVHRGCAQTLERLFQLRPIVAQPEGTELNVPANFDPQQFRLTGNVSDHPPHRGRLVHTGWEAGKCELPTWSGNPQLAMIVAPAEVEIP